MNQVALPDKLVYKILSYLPDQVLVDLDLSNEQYWNIYQTRVGDCSFSGDIRWLEKFLSASEMLLHDNVYIMSLTDLELNDDLFNPKIPVKSTKVVFREYLEGYVWHPPKLLIDASQIKQVLNTRDGTGVSGFYFDGGTTNPKILDIFNKYFFEHLWNNPDYNPEDYEHEYSSDDSFEELGNPTLRFDESCYDSKSGLDDSKSSRESDDDFQFEDDFINEFGSNDGRKDLKPFSLRNDPTLRGWPTKLVKITNTHFIPVIFYLNEKPDLSKESIQLCNKTQILLSDGEYFLWKVFKLESNQERKEIGRVVLSPKLHVNLGELAGIVLFADDAHEKNNVYGFGNFKNRRVGDDFDLSSMGRVFGQGNYAIVPGRQQRPHPRRRFLSGSPMEQ